MIILAGAFCIVAAVLASDSAPPHAVILRTS